MHLVPIHVKSVTFDIFLVAESHVWVFIGIAGLIVD